MGPLRRLAGPAVRSDHCGVLQFRPQRGGQIGGEDDVRVRANEDGRRREDDRCGVDQMDRVLAEVGRRHVERLDVHAAVGQRLDQVIDHPPCAVVHRRVWEDDHVLRRIVDPVTVRVEDERRIVVNRAVARTDQLDLVRSKHLEVSPDQIRERHHDLGVVSLRRLADAWAVDREEIVRCQVRAEQITGEQDLLLAHVGQHRFRPVDPRCVEELERAVAERQRVAMLDGGDPILGDSQVIGDHRRRLRARDDLDVRVPLEDRRRGAGVILFDVLDDQDIERLDIIELRQDLFAHRRIGGVDQRCLLGSSDEVSVVARPVGQRDQLVEQPTVPIDGPHPPDPGPDLSRFHLSSCRDSAIRSSARSDRMRTLLAS